MTTFLNSSIGEMRNVAQEAGTNKMIVFEYWRRRSKDVINQFLENVGRLAGQKREEDYIANIGRSDEHRGGQKSGVYERSGSAVQASQSETMRQSHTCGSTENKVNRTVVHGLMRYTFDENRDRLAYYGKP